MFELIGSYVNSSINDIFYTFVGRKDLGCFRSLFQGAPEIALASIDDYDFSLMPADKMHSFLLDVLKNQSEMFRRYLPKSYHQQLCNYVLANEDREEAKLLSDNLSCLNISEDLKNKLNFNEALNDIDKIRELDELFKKRYSYARNGYDYHTDYSFNRGFLVIQSTDYKNSDNPEKNITIKIKLNIFNHDQREAIFFKIFCFNRDIIEQIDNFDLLEKNIDNFLDRVINPNESEDISDKIITVIYNIKLLKTSEEKNKDFLLKLLKMDNPLKRILSEISEFNFSEASLTEVVNYVITTPGINDSIYDDLIQNIEKFKLSKGALIEVFLFLYEKNQEAALENIEKFSLPKQRLNEIFNHQMKMENCHYHLLATKISIFQLDKENMTSFFDKYFKADLNSLIRNLNSYKIDVDLKYFIFNKFCDDFINRIKQKDEGKEVDTDFIEVGSEVFIIFVNFPLPQQYELINKIIEMTAANYGYNAYLDKFAMTGFFKKITKEECLSVGKKMLKFNKHYFLSNISYFGILEFTDEERTSLFNDCLSYLDNMQHAKNFWEEILRNIQKFKLPIKEQKHFFDRLYNKRGTHSGHWYPAADRCFYFCDDAIGNFDLEVQAVFYIREMIDDESFLSFFLAKFNSNKKIIKDKMKLKIFVSLLAKLRYGHKHLQCKVLANIFDENSSAGKGDVLTRVNIFLSLLSLNIVKKIDLATFVPQQNLIDILMNTFFDVLGVDTATIVSKEKFFKGLLNVFKRDFTSLFVYLSKINGLGSDHQKEERTKIYKEFIEACVGGKYTEWCKRSPHLQRLLQEGVEEEVIDRWITTTKLDGNETINYSTSDNGQKQNERFKEFIIQRLKIDNHIENLQEKMPNIYEFLYGDKSLKACAEDLKNKIASYLKKTEDKKNLKNDEKFTALKIQEKILLALLKEDFNFKQLEKILENKQLFNQFLLDIRDFMKSSPKDAKRGDYSLIFEAGGNPEDIFLLGRETGGCQNIDGVPQYNMHLMGYADGKNKIFALKNNKGVIINRCTGRLLWDDYGKKPVIFIEPIYSLNPDKTLSDVLTNQIEAFAKKMGLELCYSSHYPLVGCSTSRITLQSFGNIAVSEYSDSVGNVVQDRISNGEFYCSALRKRAV